MLMNAITGSLFLNQKISAKLLATYYSTRTICFCNMPQVMTCGTTRIYYTIHYYNYSHITLWSILWHNLLYL